jgi:bidirectional [NiFe] hydrogenase diaphorase subunit
MSVNAPARPKAGADHPSGDQRFKLIDRTLKRMQFRQDSLIEVLHTAQEAFGYLDDDVLIYAAQQLKLPLSWVYGVATFYHFFSLKPQGEHTCIVCLGTACYVRKSGEILAALEAEFDVKSGQTTPDKKLSLAQARCVGSCGLAPVVVLDGVVHGKETADEVVAQVWDALGRVSAASEPEPVG